MSLQNLTAHTPLPLLGPHLPALIISTIAFFLLRQASITLSPRWVGSKWEGFDERTRKGWATHVVSMAHAIIIIPLALRSLSSSILAKDPIFGYDPMVGQVLAISSGYFIWDTIDSMANSTTGFVVHGACCLAVYLFSFRPFLAGFGPCFLLWELSTPLLNVHWFMEKLELQAKYPTFTLINALVFMPVFFLVRILYGGYQSYAFFQAMWTERHRIPIHLHVIYCAGNLALNGLNWLWFSKMVSKMLARLNGKDGPIKSRSEKAPLLANVKATEEDTEDEEEEGTVTLPVKPPSPAVFLKARDEGD